MGGGSGRWESVFFLGSFWGVLHLPIVPIYHPISVSEAAACPIRMMASKAGLYSIKQLCTCKYTAISCMTLIKDRGWI